MPDLVTKKSLPKLIGKGYRKFWNFRGRYRVLKGGRGSKKSTIYKKELTYGKFIL